MKTLSYLVLCSVAGLIASPIYAQITFNSTPSREIGHFKLTPLVTASPNLVEGKELYNPQGIAVDTSVNPVILYVSDTSNNRVVAWKNASAVTKGDPFDLTIGQRDQYTTLAQGPSTTLTTGFTSPTGLAVDRSGNLYVADAGNNRILRFPKPFSQTGSLLTPDLLIGQVSYTSSSGQPNNQPNEGQPVPAAKTLAITQNGAAFRVSLAFDAQGNLWVSDGGNNRVLRFPVSQLAPFTAEPAADLVLGQTTFVTNISAPPFTLPNVAISSRFNKSGLSQPSGVAFDQNGNLYISDVYNRVLYFTPPFSNGAAAQRILGVVLPVSGQTAPTINETTLGSTSSQGNLIPPEGLVTVGNNLFVMDTPNNRIVKYDTPDKWPAEATTYSPAGKAFTGQLDGGGNKVNHGAKEPSNDSLSSPIAAAFTGTELVVTDTGNQRVLSFPQQAGNTFTIATRVLGQLDFPFNAPNLIEGREVFIFAGFLNRIAVGGTAIAVDRNSNPPHLYIADSLNNRILGFRDARAVKQYDKADLVIGQPDLNRSGINWPSGDSNQLNETGLFNPGGLVVDANGNLFVADTGNGRVLRFPSPFNQPVPAGQKATLVLGQGSFFQKITDASASTMRLPSGLATLVDGSLLVSDQAFNRVLYFRLQPGSDFTNGQAANLAIGQPDFTTIAPGNAFNRLNTPLGIATDTDNRLYVCDTQNNRVLIYAQQLQASGPDPSPVLPLPGLNAPHGVAVSPISGDIWVTDTLNNQLIRYPLYQKLVLNPNPTGTITSSAPIATAFDSFDNLLVANALNRIDFYFPALAGANAASYSPRVAPGMITYVQPFPGTTFTTTQNVNTTIPISTTLGDTQVIYNGTALPLFYVYPTAIAFQIPNGAPTSGTISVDVVRPSTGQLLASGTFTMTVSSPAFFTSNAQGTGQVAALNEDNTVNTPSNPISRGHVIQIFGTGAGFFPGAPPDGTPATGPVPTPQLPKVCIQCAADFLPDSSILYSGLAPTLVGVWQLNVKIPDLAPPGNNILVVATLNDSPTNLGPGGARIVTTISVKQ